MQSFVHENTFFLCSFPHKRKCHVRQDGSITPTYVCLKQKVVSIKTGALTFPFLLSLLTSQLRVTHSVPAPFLSSSAGAAGRRGAGDGGRLPLYIEGVVLLAVAVGLGFVGWSQVANGEMLFFFPRRLVWLLSGGDHDPEKLFIDVLPWWKDCWRSGSTGVCLNNPEFVRSASDLFDLEFVAGVEVAAASVFLLPCGQRGVGSQGKEAGRLPQSGRRAHLGVHKWGTCDDGQFRLAPAIPGRMATLFGHELLAVLPLQRRISGSGWALHGDSGPSGSSPAPPSLAWLVTCYGGDEPQGLDGVFFFLFEVLVVNLKVLFVISSFLMGLLVICTPTVNI